MKLAARFLVQLWVLLWCAAIVSPALAAPEIPGKKQEKPFALVGGTVHIVSGPAIEAGAIVVDAGKIVAVGREAEVAIPAGAERIDVRGKHVFPSLIDAYSQIGLIEIDSIRATIDHTEVGGINPNVKAQVAFNPDSELIPVTRANGVLLALVAPQGGLIAGQSALMMLDGWTPEDMTLRAPVGLHVNWPIMTPITNIEIPETQKQQVEARNKQLEALKKSLDDARAYLKAKRAGSLAEHDLRWEAMAAVLDPADAKAEKLRVFVRADELAQIESAVAWAEREKLRIVIVGGYDAPRCAELLKKHSVPVIVTGVHRLPLRKSDAYDEPFTLPERLRAAGISFCICEGGRFAASGTRNLPYHAGTASAHGLAPLDALRSVTLYAAQILGASDRVGSLDSGKDATLFVADGDILETPAKVERAWVQGRAVDLNNRHQRLYEKYREKYRRLTPAK